MNYCIYYQKTKNHLRFEKEEHVIPAGLGGITKLQRGVVSDEANELFSKVELKALRNSLISVNRTNLGPGKRGNLNFNNIKNPQMRVLQSVDIPYEVEFPLGFIYAGDAYLIPQLVLNIEDKGTVLPVFMASPFHEDSVKEFPLGFNKKLRLFLKNRKRSWKLIKMPYETNEHFITIGFYKGNWYAATSHKIINMDVFALEFLPMIENMIKKQIVYKGNSLPSDTHPLLKYTGTIDMEAEVFYFLYVKTAFNALALFKGSKFINEEIYNNVRNSILIQEKLEDYIKEKSDSDGKIKNYIKEFPDKSHYIIVEGKDNIICAYVSFYGEPPVKVQLTNEYKGGFFLDGLICDWKNRKEGRLGKWIS